MGSRVGDENIDMCFVDLQALKFHQTPSDECSSDAATLVSRIDGQVLQVAAPAIVTAHHAADKACARLATKLSFGFRTR